MILDIVVTTQHVKDGQATSLGSPITLALREMGYRAAVYYSGIIFKDEQGQWWEAQHTKKTKNFMNRLAGKQPVKSDRFRLRFTPD